MRESVLNDASSLKYYDWDEQLPSKIPSFGSQGVLTVPFVDDVLQVYILIDVIDNDRISLVVFTGDIQTSLQNSTQYFNMCNNDLNFTIYNSISVHIELVLINSTFSCVAEGYRQFH